MMEPVLCCQVPRSDNLVKPKCNLSHKPALRAAAANVATNAETILTLRFHRQEVPV
jgi:hypothetical protein